MFVRFCFLFLLSALAAHAQTGLNNDDFSTGGNHGWTDGGGTSLSVVGGKLIAPTGPDTGDRWGSVKKPAGMVLHAGRYPIFATRMGKPPKCNFFLDTPKGSYDNTNNNFLKIALPGGNVYYYDLSAGTLGTTILPTDTTTALGFVQFKVAEIQLTSAQLAAKDTSYPVYWVRTYPSLDSLRKDVEPGWFTRPQPKHPAAFVHPGLLHDTADFSRMRRIVAAKSTTSRAYKCYQNLSTDYRALSTYAVRGPYSEFTRDASLTIDGVGGGAIHNNVEVDVMAAYYNAILWQVTGDLAHAAKAQQILDGYAAKDTGIAGSDAALNGLYGFMLANAAEIMAMPGSGWTQAKADSCRAMLKKVFYPVLHNFVSCAHGNWDIIAMKCLLSIAIFSDDHDMYDRVMDYFCNGEGNGSIGNYVVSDSGQLEESNRDQPHSMLALGCLAELSEMAWKQGDDLYSANKEAIRRGYEYTARYNLGQDVPYQLHYDYCERNYADYTPEAVSANGRGNIRAVFEIGWNHYAALEGSAMPWTRKVLDSIYPNGEGTPFGADNPGFGSFLFGREAQASAGIRPATAQHPRWRVQGRLLILDDLPANAEVTVRDLQGALLSRIATGAAHAELLLPAGVGTRFACIRTGRQFMSVRIPPTPWTPATPF
jgi:hypothetical protein